MTGFLRKAAVAACVFAVSTCAGFAMNRSACADPHGFDGHRHESVVCDGHDCDSVAEDPHHDGESGAILVAKPRYDRPCDVCGGNGKCSACKGKGKCSNCSGKGKVYGNVCQICKGKKKCHSCSGSKKCSVCKGKGHYVH